MSEEEVANLERQYASIMQAVASIQDHVTLACGDDAINTLASGDRSTTRGNIGLLRTLLSRAPTEPVRNFEDLHSMTKSIWDAMVLSGLSSLTVKFIQALKSQIDEGAGTLSEQRSRLSQQDTELSEYNRQLSEHESLLETEKRNHADAVRKFENTLRQANEKVAMLTADNTSLERLRHVKSDDEATKVLEKRIEHLKKTLEENDEAANLRHTDLSRMISTTEEKLAKSEQESKTKIAKLEEELTDSKDLLKRTQGNFAHTISAATKPLEDKLGQAEAEQAKSRKQELEAWEKAKEYATMAKKQSETIKQQEQELKTLKSNLKRAERKAIDEFNEHHKMNEKLKGQVATAQASAQAALNSNSEITREKLSLSGELKALQCKLRKFDDVERKRRMSEQADMLKILCADMNSLKAKMQDITGERKAMKQACREEIAALMGLLRAYKEMVDFLRSCLAQQNSTGDSEADLVTLPRAQLEHLTGQRDSLLKKVEVLKVRAAADQGQEGTKEEDAQKVRPATSAGERELQQYRDQLKRVSTEKVKLEEQIEAQQKRVPVWRWNARSSASRTRSWTRPLSAGWGPYRQQVAMAPVTTSPTMISTTTTTKTDKEMYAQIDLDIPRSHAKSKSLSGRPTQTRNASFSLLMITSLRNSISQPGTVKSRQIGRWRAKNGRP